MSNTLDRRLPLTGSPPRRSLREQARASLQALRSPPAWLTRAMARRRITSWLYYVLFSRAFAREQHAVLYGRIKYQEGESAPDHNEALLRRNVHRLEKGLIMRPRRDVFAADYIEETVDSFLARRTAAACGPGLDPEGLEWAEDVLRSYFDVVGAHPGVDRARAAFVQGLEGEAARGAAGAERKSPFVRDLSAPPPVAFEDLYRLARRRRSVRWFLPRPVERELVDQALLVAAQSPTACNRQPYEFRIFDDPEMVARVSALPGGSAGFRENFPMIVVVIGRQRSYFDERDRHVIYIDGALAAMSFAFALETLGLSSCMINWPDVEVRERRMAEMLRLEPDERPIMQIAVGYPDPDAPVPYSGKKSLDTIRRYNAL
jgi:nitroreductase